jgi:hypothetical protein
VSIRPSLQTFQRRRERDLDALEPPVRAGSPAPSIGYATLDVEDMSGFGRISHGLLNLLRRRRSRSQPQLGRGAPMKSRLPWLFVVLLVALVVKLASVVIALENRIYASEVGVCYEPVNYTKDPEARERREECLLRTRGRSDFWNLYYALTTR